jgi:hypothetical protein
MFVNKSQILVDLDIEVTPIETAEQQKVGPFENLPSMPAPTVHKCCECKVFLQKLLQKSEKACHDLEAKIRSMQRNLQLE